MTASPPTRLTIDLAAVCTNWRRMAQRIAPAECAAVVKANAYGLGAEKVGPALYGVGARTFFTAHLEEAVALRSVLPRDASISVLNGLLPGTEAIYQDYGLTPVLNDLGQVTLWSKRATAEAAALAAFLQIDTGMHRMGMDVGEFRTLLAEPERLAGIDVSALMSHLACADDGDHPLTLQQYNRFKTAQTDLARSLGRTVSGSLANSAGLWRDTALVGDLARPGCALYGVQPCNDLVADIENPVRLEAQIIQVRTLETAGQIGYGATRTLPAGSRVATIPVGYADGYLRSIGDQACVLLDGRRIPLVGRVSMDLITLDVSAIPESVAVPGRWVDVIGSETSPDRLAAMAGTIGYEILTSLGSRYDRHYV